MVELYDDPVEDPEQESNEIAIEMKSTRKVNFVPFMSFGYSLVVS